MMKYNRLRVVLDDQGRSQTWLAEQVGATRATINSIYHNRSQPSLKRLFELAEALEVPAYTLIGDYESLKETSSELEKSESE